MILTEVAKRLPLVARSNLAIRRIFMLLAVGLSSLSGCVTMRGPSSCNCIECRQTASLHREDPLTDLARSVDQLVTGSADNGPIATGALGAPKIMRREPEVRSDIVLTSAEQDTYGPLAELRPPEISSLANGGEANSPACECGQCDPVIEQCGSCPPPVCTVGCLPRLPDVGRYLQPAEEFAPPGRFFPVPTRPVFSPQTPAWLPESLCGPTELPVDGS